MAEERTKAHPLWYQNRNSFFNAKTGMTTYPEYTAPITIKDNCRIAASVTICGGVTIGESCVIGAGSVVTKDIPPYSPAVGKPRPVLHQITDADRLSVYPELYTD